MCKLRFISFLLSCMIFSMAYGGNSSVSIEYLTGEEKDFYMNLLKKIEIKESCLSFIGNDCSVIESVDINSVRKISFVSPTGLGIGNDLSVDSGKLNVYMLDDNMLRIEMDTPGQIVRVFDTSGNIYYSEKLSDNTADINLSVLSSGIFLLQYGNSIVKFIKD